MNQLTQRISVAYDWTLLLSQTAAGYKYAKSQQAAWRDARVLVDALKPPFDLASTANPAMLSQYPAIARLLGAKSVVAMRAATSRAKKVKADTQTALDAARASATSTQTSAPAPAAATPAVGEASGAAAAAAPARVGTVQGWRQAGAPRALGRRGERGERAGPRR